MTRQHEKKRIEFEKTYNDFFEPIFLFLASRLNDRERAKEIAQETFMKTWMHLVKGNTIFLMRPFLYTTAYNLFKNELRSKKKNTISLDALVEEQGFDVKDTLADAEHLSLTEELYDRLDQLPPIQRETLRLRYIEGLPIQEIATKLQESPTAISVRIHRAVKQLKEIYQYEKLD